MLNSAGIRSSRRRRATPSDNAQAERFMNTLKDAEVHSNEYEPLEAARASIGQCLEDVYNHTRLHSALGYRPPAEFEELITQPPPP